MIPEAMFCRILRIRSIYHVHILLCVVLLLLYTIDQILPIRLDPYLRVVVWPLVLGGSRGLAREVLLAQLLHRAGLERILQLLGGYFRELRGGSTNYLNEP